MNGGVSFVHTTPIGLPAGLITHRENWQRFRTIEHDKTGRVRREVHSKHGGILLRRAGYSSVGPDTPPSGRILLRRAGYSSVGPDTPPSDRILLRRAGYSSSVVWHQLPLSLELNKRCFQFCPVECHMPPMLFHKRNAVWYGIFESSLSIGTCCRRFSKFAGVVGNKYCQMSPLKKRAVVCFLYISSLVPMHLPSHPSRVSHTHRMDGSAARPMPACPAGLRAPGKVAAAAIWYRVSGKRK
eukprot:gene14104-biopygen12614